MSESFAEWLRESSAVKTQMAEDGALVARLEQTAGALRTAVQRGGCIYACGNGGSACDAMHLCEELVARFKRERKGIRAMHFMDPGIITCWANDYSYDDIFARCADTFCGADDALIGFSTSGNSRNVLRALERARAKGSVTIGLTGKDGGAMRAAAEYCLIVPSAKTERIQEAHITIVHMLCEMLERG